MLVSVDANSFSSKGCLLFWLSGFWGICHYSVKVEFLPCPWSILMILRSTPMWLGEIVLDVGIGRCQLIFFERLPSILALRFLRIMSLFCLSRILALSLKYPDDTEIKPDVALWNCYSTETAFSGSMWVSVWDWFRTFCFSSQSWFSSIS